MLTETFCLIHIPRCGGSALKALLRQHVRILGDAGHRTGAELAWLDVPKIALLRDPWGWYGSVAQAPYVAECIKATYAETVQHFLYHADGTSRAFDKVYCWPWDAAVAALLQDIGLDIPPPHATYRHVRATRSLPLRQIPAADAQCWRAHGHSI